MVTKRFAAVFFVALLLVGTIAKAQTTATLVGTVTTDGSPLPGATVSISSPALQGIRTTTTGANGDYSFPALPPGKYTVTLELEGMQKLTRTAELRLAETARADGDLKVSAVAEAITVTASSPSVLETPQVSVSLTREQVEALPIGRTIAQRIQLAPGVNNAGPNNQTIINGAPSYDNLYMVNGVVVNDSIRGQPENLFIEDAIQETTLITGGVSAEYGRFTGGVVNTLTKSGGNEFSASVRDNITNESWRNETVFQDPVSGAPQPENVDDILHQYEATLGGYFMKDRLWFFGAGRKFDQAIARVTTATNIAFVNQLNNKRYEVKLTGQVTPKHTLVGSYLKNDTDETNNRFGNVVDLRSLSDRQLPNWLQSYHYSGVITDALLVEAQFSRRYFAFIGGGGPKDDIINGTLLRDNTTARRMWSPTFCACDPKTRNNKNFLVKGNYFLSTKALGSHSVVAGYDDFHELRTENNFQSGSNYRLWGDFVHVGQETFFSINPSTGQVAFNPIEQLSKTNDFATKSLFVNDRWDFNSHMSFNLGLRYDKNEGKDQAHNTIADDSSFSPRLSAVYDVKANGKMKFSASYAKYVAKIDSGIGDTISTAGSPGSIYFNYDGPVINPRNAAGQIIGTPVPTAEVIRQIFAWFTSVGGVSGYKDIDTIFVPGLTERLLETIKSPNMQEYSLGYGHQIGGNGYLRADYINRSWSDFYTLRRDLSTGKNLSAAGTPVDVGVIENNDEGLSRKYNGLQLQSAYRIGRMNLGGNYTWSTLKGNVEGESFNNATIFVGNNQYPEYQKFARNQPDGYLDGDIRHRANLYGNYDLALPFGSLNIGLLQRYHSASPYSALAVINPGVGRADGPAAGVGVANPGYATPPSSVNYYFSDRGEFRVDNITSTDVTLNYDLPIGGKVHLFLRGDVTNSFDEDGVEFASTNLGGVVERRVYTRRQRARSTDSVVALTAFNPYTTTPVQYVPGTSPATGTYHYQLDPNFGKPTSFEAYQLPRTYRFAVGLRF